MGIVPDREGGEGVCERGREKGGIVYERGWEEKGGGKRKGGGEERDQSAGDRGGLGGNSD